MSSVESHSTSSGSSYFTSGNNYTADVVLCDCEEQTSEYESYRKETAGRRFLGCSKKSAVTGRRLCKFKLWLDDPFDERLTLFLAKLVSTAKLAKAIINKMQDDLKEAKKENAQLWAIGNQLGSQVADLKMKTINQQKEFEDKNTYWLKKVREAKRETRMVRTENQTLKGELASNKEVMERNDAFLVLVAEESKTRLRALATINETLERELSAAKKNITANQPRD